MALAFSSFMLLTLPRYQDMQVSRTQERELTRELQNRETYFADLRDVQARLDEFPDELAKVEAAIPGDPRLPALYDFLQSSAAFSGLTLKSISSSLKEAAGGSLVLRQIPVTLELTGSYNAAKEFLSKLYTASRMAQVTSVNLTGGTSANTFNLTLQLQAFSY